MRPIVVGVGTAMLIATRTAFGFCDVPAAASIDDPVAFFQTTTFELRLTQSAGSAAMKALKSPTSTPFDVVYALKSNVLELQCAESAVARFTKSDVQNIELSASGALKALHGLQRAVEGMLARVNATLGSAPPSEAQIVNDSADEALKGQDAVDLLVNAAEMSAMLVRTCDTSTNKCNKLLLSSDQRKNLGAQWSAMAKTDDAIGHFATVVAEFLRNPEFHSAP